MPELSNNFIEEIFKACITSKSTMDVLNKHMDYEHLPTEGYKTIWKEIRTFYEIESKLPTIGIINQNLEGLKDKELKLDCRHILASIKKSKVENVHDQLIQSFESYKKEVDFVNLYKEVSEIYDEDRERAIKHMAKKSEEISTFSIKDGVYDRVFKDFEKRQNERRLKDPDLYDERIPSGIHEFDYYTRGGFKKGTSFLALGRSGTGKSTLLRWIAINAARLGKKVVLFSLEGLREETLEALDSAWTSTPLDKMEFGNLEVNKLKEIEKSLQGVLNSGGEIYVHSSEGFDGMSIEQSNATVHEIRKLYGDVDMVLFDYLELFDVESVKVGKDSSGERRRREALANKITDMAIEHRCVTGSATQANDIPPNLYNNENFVLTRTNVSEFKGVIKPFSYFFTINQTEDESDQNVCRLYCDKFRKHRSGQTINLYQRMDINRFYDSFKTLKHMWNKEINRKIQ
jgi:DNA replication protein DnaC